jgi:hypothetical protein
MADTQETSTDEQVDRIVLQSARAAATAIAYQEIAQSLALAVQSGVQHLQGLFTVNIATTGAIFSQALEGAEDPRELERRLEASQKTVQVGIRDLVTLTQAASEALQGFPSGDAPTAKASPEEATSPAAATQKAAGRSGARKAGAKSSSASTKRAKS